MFLLVVLLLIILPLNIFSTPIDEYKLSVSTEKNNYKPRENIFIVVSATPRSFFNLAILNPNSIKIYEKSAITDSS